MHNNILRLQVWNKGRPIPGKGPRYDRLDVFGNHIKFNRYGNRNSLYGWEIDHIWPKAFSGTNNIDNLRPLHWQENAQHGGFLSNWKNRVSLSDIIRKPINPLILLMTS